MAWQALLAKAVLAEESQAAVARKLGYSPATISKVLAGTYVGNLAAIEQKVMEIYGGRTMQGEEQKVPDGYMRNAVGHLVPIESIKEVDLLRDGLVKKIVAEARDVSSMLAQFKKSVAGDVQAHFELVAEEYKKNMTDSKVSFDLFSFDGKYKLTREYAERLDFDERLQVAKALVDECLHEWSQDSGPELKTIVEQAFKVNKKGKINTRQILSLRSYKIDHPTWKQAMEAISDAVTVVDTCIYYRLYERDDEGKYHQLALDFSKV